MLLVRLVFLNIKNLSYYALEFVVIVYLIDLLPPRVVYFW